MDKEDIMRTNCECFLVEGTVADKITWPRVLWFESQCSAINKERMNR